MSGEAFGLLDAVPVGLLVIEAAGEGPEHLVRAMPKWFGLHPFASIEHPASRPRVSA